MGGYDMIWVFLKYLNASFLAPLRVSSIQLIYGRFVQLSSIS